MPSFYSCFWLTAGSAVGAKQPPLMPGVLLGHDSLPPHASRAVNCCWLKGIPLQELQVSAGVSPVGVFQWSTSCWTEASGWGCVTSSDFPMPFATPASAHSSLVFPCDRGWAFVLPLTHRPMATALGCSQQGSCTARFRNCFSERRRDDEVNVTWHSCVPALCQISKRCFSQKLVFWNTEVLKWYSFTKLYWFLTLQSLKK